MTRQSPLAVETGENAEGSNAFRDSPRQCDINFSQCQQLGTVDQPRIPSGTSRSDGQMRPGDSQVDRNLSRRVVGDRSRVVIIRPGP